MKHHTHNRGFTLIELLVVIAIIGILSGVVLLSLGTARNKSKNVKIQAEVNQIRDSFELEFASTTYPSLGSTADGSYVTSSSPSVSPEIATLLGEIDTVSGATTYIYATSSDMGYAIIANFVDGNQICSDSFANSSSSYTGTASNVDCTK
jgi:prepilin-type N-terminal cleavage/methylation domain-containing protein